MKRLQLAASPSYWLPMSTRSDDGSSTGGVCEYGCALKVMLEYFFDWINEKLIWTTCWYWLRPTGAAGALRRHLSVMLCIDHLLTIVSTSATRETVQGIMKHVSYQRSCSKIDNRGGATDCRSVHLVRFGTWISLLECEWRPSIWESLAQFPRWYGSDGIREGTRLFVPFLRPGPKELNLALTERSTPLPGALWSWSSTAGKMGQEG